jgi:hypothetical protein
MQFKLWLEDQLCEIKYSEKMGLDSGDITSFLGKSVVRRPVYHGTNAVFDEFKITKSQRFVLFSAFDVESHGFFFAESFKDAKEYGRNIITAYVRLVNPLVDPRIMPNLGLDRLPYKKEAEIAYILRHMHEKEIPNTPVRYYKNPLTGELRDVPKEDQFRTRKYMDLMVQRHYIDSDFAKRKDYTWIYHVITPGGLMWDCLDNPKVAQAMKRLGYDGTFVQENEQKVKDRSVFVMSPDQIKIVDVRKI